MKPLLVKMGMCSLNNDPLSFKKNRDHIIESIRMCKQLGCVMRLGNELQTSGYQCADHFNEYDTVVHSWGVVGDIIKSGVTAGILCDIGSPVIHHGNMYNCRILIIDGKIKGIRAKMNLADGDNYYETRWFGFWKEPKKISQFKLPKNIQEITGQKEVPIGDFLVQFNDTTLAYEICQESWISNNPMIDAALDGAEIVVNPSASYVERGKLERKMQMFKEATQRHGGCYLYVNAKGAIGERSYFDGGSICTENGVVKHLAPLNNLDEVTVVPVIANLTNIRTFRLSNKSFLKSTRGVEIIPRVKIQMDVAICEENYIANNPEEIKKINNLISQYHFPHARYEPSLFLWDYLRKSKAGGFFLALSGGLDSCSVALIVYNMCVIVFKEISQRKNNTVLKDLRVIIEDAEYIPNSAEEICGKILFTSYFGTQNSSKQTLERAKKISSTINCHFRNVDFHSIYEQYAKLCNQSLGFQLKYHREGGSWRTDIALQNIQARSRMLLAYLFAQTELELPKRKGYLLVLGSSNLDESLRGYFTKYDCSSADINPIASFSKLRLKQFLKWNYEQYKFSFIHDVLNATPTAQLRPLKQGEVVQTDEEDMGLTYAELGLFGKLRRVDKLGPVSMFNSIQSSGISSWDARTLGNKIKHFFRCYGKNRHKMTTLTPGYHYEPEGCDDNRLDMRPVLYETDWEYQFQLIDERVQQIENEIKLKKEQKSSLA